MLRLALVGCGDSAQAYSAAGLRLRGATFVAVVDPDLDKARLTAHSVGAAVSGSSLDDLLAQAPESFDGVLIDWANVAHAELVSKAAGAGKHVLVEPPLALSASEADAAIAACRSAGVRLMVGHSARFLDSLQKVKESLDSGKLGEPGLLRVHRWEPLPGVSLGQLEPDAEESGGTVLDRVIREIDAAIWLFGSMPTEVYAVGRRQSSPEPRMPDYVQVHLGFPRGGMALIDYSMALPQGQGYFSLSVIGSSGATYADDHHNIQLLYGGGDPSALNTGEGNGHMVAQLQEFVDAIQQNREPAVTGVDGRAAVQVAEAVQESVASGRAARLEGGVYGPA